MRFSLAALVLFFGFSFSHAAEVDPSASKTVTTAMAAIQKVIDRKMPPKRGFALRNFARLAETPTDADALADKISSKTNTDDCEFILPIDEDPSNPDQGDDGLSVDLQSQHIEIKGDKCPLVAVIDVVVTTNEPRIDAVITMHFEARTPELQREMGAIRSGLSGALGGTIEKTPDGSARFGISANLDGLCETVNFGEISQSISYSVGGALLQPPEGTDPNFDDMINIKMNEAQRYQSGGNETRLSSEFVMKGLNMTARYFIGEKEVTEAEYKKYQSDLVLPGFEKPGQEPTPGPGPGPAPIGSPMMCIVQVFDANEVPLQAIQDYLKGAPGGLPGFPLQSMAGCSQDMAMSFPYKGQNVAMGFQFGPEYVLATVSAGGISTPMYAQNDDNTALAGQTSNITHLLICNPVEQCR